MGRTRNQRKAFGRWLRKLPRIIKAVDSHTSFRSFLADILPKEVPQPELQTLPLKHIRLQQLANAGFNTPEFLYSLRGELNPTEVEEFRIKHGRISLRTFREERILEKTPELPVEWDKSDPSFISDFCIRNNRQYHIMVNKAIPLEDSVLAGNIILLDSDQYIVSYFGGWGSPRHAAKKKPSELKVYLRHFGSEPPVQAPEQIEALIPQLREFHKDFRPITFEFSIYPYPVGLQQRPEILWEWRSGSTHDLKTVISKLLERADSHEMTFQLPSPGLNKRIYASP